MEKSQISISLVAQLPTFKKSLLDKMKKMSFFWAQGVGVEVPGEMGQGQQRPFGAFSPLYTSFMLRILDV